MLEKEKWVASFFLNEQNMQRISLTAPVVNAASCVVFMLSGKNKAVAVEQVLTKQYKPELYPAQIIQPTNGNLYWMMDTSAASLISK